mgnify:CR=1 FL=1
MRAAEARRLDGLLPANGERPALRARHRLDGYGKSAMVLYEADAKVDDIYKKSSILKKHTLREL